MEEVQCESCVTFFDAHFQYLVGTQKSKQNHIKDAMQTFYHNNNITYTRLSNRANVMREAAANITNKDVVQKLVKYIYEQLGALYTNQFDKLLNPHFDDGLKEKYTQWLKKNDRVIPFGASVKRLQQQVLLSYVLTSNELERELMDKDLLQREDEYAAIWEVRLLNYTVTKELLQDVGVL
jgi:hypothetical protein